MSTVFFGKKCQLNMVLHKLSTLRVLAAGKGGQLDFTALHPEPD
jgi:hypothetical protein